VDSDFPPNTDRASGGYHDGAHDQPFSSPPNSPPSGGHKRATSGIGNKIFGRLTHAIQGVTDQDPERARRDALGKTKESLVQLEQALEVSQKDVKDASQGVMQDLRRFQGQKEDDLRMYMVSLVNVNLQMFTSTTDIRL
jgi:hypothetical protein